MGGGRAPAPPGDSRCPARGTNNLALVVLDTAILRLAFPILAVGLAVMAEEWRWGLFNNVDVPRGLAVLASMLPVEVVGSSGPRIP